MAFRRAVPTGLRVLAVVALICTCLTFGHRAGAQGPINRALAFDGVNDYVTFGAAPGLGAQSFTLELWFKRDGPGVGTSTGAGGIPSAIPLVTKGRAQAEGSNVDMNYFFGIDSATGVLVADFEDTAGGVNHPVTAATPAVIGRWNHAAATYNAVTGTWNLYLNGVLDRTLPLSSAFIPRFDSIQHAAVASAIDSNGNASGFFGGVVDEVRIWNVVRTQAEIQAGMGVDIPAAAGLIGRWGLDDGAGLTATDGSGNAIHGTLTPAANPPAWTDGTPFQSVAGPHAIDFNGTTNYVTFGQAPALGATVFTLEAWIRRDGAGVITSTGAGGITNAIPILTKGRGEADGGTNVDTNYFLGLNAATHVLIADYEEGAGQASPSLNHPVSGVTPIPADGTWHHVAATFDGTTWNLYVDGVFDGTSVVGAGRLPRSDSIQHAAIGSALTSTGVAAGFFDGAIDEARVWNYARTQPQIAGGMSREIPAAAGLLGRWSLNELVQNANTLTTTNSASAGLTGTVIGATALTGWRLVGGAPFTAPPNAAPVVSAGGDQAVTLPASASLQGSIVADDGVPGNATVAWSKLSGPGTVTFGDATQPATTASFSIDGVYVLRLVATDGELQAFDDVTVTVSPEPQVNQAPVVDAGGDQTIALPAFATLDASVTDDGLPAPPALTTIWTLVDGPGTVTFGDPNAIDTTATFSTTGVYTLRLTANDGELADDDDVIVTVNAEGASAIDFGGTNAYVAFGNPSKLHLATFTVETWFRRDGSGLATTTGTGGVANAIPLVTRGRGEAENPAVDLNYFLGIDAATGVLAADFEEGAGGSSPSLNHPVVGVTPIANGVWHHAAATYDGSKWQLFLDGQLEAELVVDEPPAAAGNQHAAIGSALTSTGAPAGFFDGAIDETRIWNRALTIDEIRASINSEVTSAPDLVARWGLNEGAGTTVFDSAADPATGTILGAAFTWAAGAPFDLNLPPVVTNPGDQAHNEGTLVALQIVATDPNPLDVLAYSAANLPPGLAIDPVTGEIGGTISSTAASGSPYSVIVTVTDNGTPARSGQASFTWTVQDVNEPPVVTDPGDQTTAEGTAVSLQIVATDPDPGQTMTYGATNLPGGLTIDPSTGLISGTISFTAANASPYSVTVTVTDNGSPILVSNTAFTWNVTNVNAAPVVTNPGDQFDTEGDVVSVAVTGTDPDGDSLTFAASGLPPGLSIDAGTGSITGTIETGAAAGSPYTVTITVSDSAVPPASSPAVFTWTVISPGANFALDFDGSNDHVSFASSSTLNLSTFTIEAWINRQGAGIGTDTGAGGVPSAIPLVTKGTSEVDQQDSRDMNYFVGIDVATGVLIADFEEGAGGSSPSLNHPVYGTTVIPTGVWTHVAATYDGTSWRLYVNGVLDATLNVGEPPRADSIQPFGIATAFESDLSPEGFFDGIIDEVRVWDHARSAQEILDDLQHPLTSGAGLVARWGFDEGVNTALNDTIGAVHGVVQNGAVWVAGAPFGTVQTVTVSFRDGVNGFGSTVDTHIREAAPSTAHGTAATVEWDVQEGTTPNSTKFGLLRFDNLFGTGPGQIPPGAIIQSATLTYTVVDVGDAATVNEVAVDWGESVTFDTFGASPGVQAGDFGAQVGTASGAALGAQTLDVRSSLAAWSANPTANRGWIFRPTNTDGTQIRSSDGTTAGERPQLSVTFVVPPGSNLTPVVSAGADQSITLPSSAALDGSVSDDGLPDPPANVTTTWSKISGPGTVTFGDANAVDTTATFSSAGTYVLRLTADDSAATSFDEVTISVSLASSGSAVDFNGTNAYMSIASPTALGAAVFTIEAWIRREGAGVGTDTGTGGIQGAIPIVTKGTSEVDQQDNRDMNYFLGIDASTGVLIADFEEGAGGASPGQNHPVSGARVIQMNTWTHVAATYDGTTWRLYVDGTLDGELTVGQPVRADSIQPFGIATAFESDLSPEGFFDGTIDEVRVWSTARSATEIQNSMFLQIADAPNLIGRWGFDEGSGASAADTAGTSNGTLNGTFAWVAGAPLGGGNAPDQPVLVAPADGATGVATSPTLSVLVSDPSANPLTVDFHGRRVSGTARDFTIVAIPDTQHYVDSANFPIFTAQTQWIVDNRDALNIVFATQLGDITQNIDAVELEWQRADASMAVLDVNGLPNSVVPGNHDLNSSGVGNFFDQYFPPSRYLGQPWYGGYLGSDPQDSIDRLNKNNYNLFSVDGLDFILINLEYDMPGYAVEWANRILQQFPNRRAIISTHMFINASGGRPTTTHNRPDGTSAEAVWQQLISPNCNVFLVLNGHYPGEARRTDLNTCGQAVHQLNQDYQDRQNGGDGWLRYLVFKPSENKIYAFTFSPTRNSGQGEFETDAQSQFVLDYDMQGTAFNVIGTQNVASGAQASIQWPSLFEGRQYEWFVTVSNGTASTTGPTWSFTTQLPTLPTPPSDVMATAVTFSSIDISWTDNSNNEETFVIERSVAGGAFTPFATVSANTTARLDTGLQGSTTYCYRVAATNGAGTSAFSAEGCATTPIAPLSRTFQNGAGGYAGTSDTHIKQGDPANVFGALDTFGWDGSETNSLPNHALIRFDTLFGNGAGQVPLGAQIVSATLSFNVFDPGDAADLREVLVNWSESDSFNTFGGDPGVQADEIGAVIGSVSGSSTGIRSVDVTASIAAWILNPSANRGWILQPTNTNGVDVRSSEYAVVAERPVLTILYHASTNPPVNQPPVVSAGIDQTITLPAGAALDGTVTDDGFVAAVTTTWSQVGGPGTVTFGNPSSVDTSATFSMPGNYVLRLTAHDGEHTAFDELAITVNAALANLLANPGFESAGTAWLNTTHSGRAVVTTQFHSGSASAEIVVSNRFLRDILQTVAVTGNTLYNARGWVKTQGIAAGARIALEWRDAASGVIRTDVVGLLQGTVDWTERVAAFTSPANAASVAFVLHTLAEPDNIGTAWFDDLLLTSAPPANQAPTVAAGNDQTITFPGAAALDGTVTDDGLPAPAAVTTIWSVVSGPGTVTFDDANALDTSASFSVDGTYVLRLTADDGELEATDDVTIIVNPQAPNQAPTVNAGLDQILTLPSGASLDGTVSDDGLVAPLVTTWSQVSGPETVTFGDAASVDTAATFPAAGEYVLRLTANDGQFETTDDVTITVNVPPANLLVNPGFESAGTGWQNTAHAGRSVVTTQFHSGTASVQILVAKKFARDVFQTVAVSGNTLYTASGWVKTQGIAAGGRIALEWRDAANAVLRTDIVGPSPVGTVDWTERAAMFTSPANATSVTFALQMFAEPDNSGTAWFDDLLLTSAPPSNQAPTVTAGNDQTITFPGAAALDGTVAEDGLPGPPAEVTTLWSIVNGPGTVTFGDATAVDTTASFSVDGTYVLRLTADDGELDASDDVVITVNPQAPNQAPGVDPGADQTITLSAGAVLDGTVTDDGLPNPPGLVTTEWSQVNGPAGVTFADAAAVDTTATFSMEGTYVLRLTANDGEFVTTGDVTITVNPQPVNLLVNPGFESGGTGWLNTAHTGRSVVTTQFHSGSASAQIVVAKKFARDILQTVTVTGNTLYTAGGWVKTQGIAGGGRILLEWRDATNAVIRTDIVGVLPLGSVDWTERTASFTSPATATSVVFTLLTLTEPDNTGTVWFDDLLFFKP